MTFALHLLIYRAWRLGLLLGMGLLAPPLAAMNAHELQTALERPLPPPGVAGAQWAGGGAGQSPHADIEMFVGETRIFPAPDVARIAVGNSQIVHAAAADEREVVVFARAPGDVSLVIWAHDGTSRHLHIRVVDNQLRQTQDELAAFVARIPNVRGTVVGEKLIIEGGDLSDADHARIAELAQRYPQIIDFTDQVGWDRMVLFDVQVVELPRTRMRDLGIRWESASQGGVNLGLVWDAGVAPGILSRPGEGGLDAALFMRGMAGYAGINALWPARIHALAQEGEAVLLAQPQLMARSGSTASFLAGGELPYTHVDANGHASTIFKPYGVTLEVAPRIDRGGSVRATIDVEVSAVDPTVNTTSGPALRTRRTRTEFNLRSGQTLVLSGFLSRERVNEEDRVPVLGSLPLLGALFRARREEHKDIELAIFVTPVVVASDHPQLQERVARGRAILQETFPQAPVFHQPIELDPWEPARPFVAADSRSRAGTLSTFDPFALPISP